MQATQEILKSKEFTDFFNCVCDYCNFIENYSAKSDIDYLKLVRKQLMKLFDSALRLPWVDLSSNLEYDYKLGDKEHDLILKRIGENIGELRYYWHVFDPSNEKDIDAVCGDLVDDLGDIYFELISSLQIFNMNKPDCKEIALWEFKFGFEKHWDDHCINAMYAIHFFLKNE